MILKYHLQYCGGRGNVGNYISNSVKYGVLNLGGDAEYVPMVTIWNIDDKQTINIYIFIDVNLQK